jgi:hypothetical protein
MCNFWIANICMTWFGTGYAFNLMLHCLYSEHTFRHPNMVFQTGGFLIDVYSILKWSSNGEVSQDRFHYIINKIYDWIKE